MSRATLLVLVFALPVSASGFDIDRVQAKTGKNLERIIQQAQEKVLPQEREEDADRPVDAAPPGASQLASAISRIVFEGRGPVDLTNLAEQILLGGEEAGEAYARILTHAKRDQVQMGILQDDNQYLRLGLNHFHASRLRWALDGVDGIKAGLRLENFENPALAPMSETVRTPDDAITESDDTRVSFYNALTRAHKTMDNMKEHFAILENYFDKIPMESEKAIRIKMFRTLKNRKLYKIMPEEYRSLEKSESMKKFRSLKWIDPEEAQRILEEFEKNKDKGLYQHFFEEAQGETIERFLEKGYLEKTRFNKE